MKPIVETTQHKEKGAIKVLTSTSTSTVEEALKAFFVEKKYKSKKALESRDILVQNFILRGLREKGWFNLEQIIPFEDVCSECNGAGKIFKFFLREDKRRCKSCHGTGKRGTHTCITCRGTGVFKKLVREPVIKSHNECQNCQGLGWVKKPENPVLTPDLAELVKIK